jgi:CRP-like cAMP-binding protein
MNTSSLDMAKRLPLFAGVPAGALRQLMRTSELKVMAAHAPLFDSGDPAKGAYLPITARVVIRFPGGTETIEEFGPGQMFGELGLLTDVKRMQDAVVVQAGEILHIPRSEFMRLLDSNPQIAEGICTQLTVSLQETTRDVLALKQRFLDGA